MRITGKQFTIRHTAYWLCATALLFLAYFKPAHALTPDKIAAKAIPSIVLIRTEDSLGTGFIVSRDGLIATNLHVIGAHKSATVVLDNEREYEDIKVVNYDPSHDLILLKIPEKNLVPLSLGDSSKVNVGERVVAIGHPLGLGNTVSDGLISAVRKINPKLTILQVSAPISQGSSGGPLFNAAGEVIGISTLVARKGQNLNFGIPINQLKALIRPDPGVALAEWNPQELSSPRNVPRHDVSLLDDCSAEQLTEIRDSIDDAISIGAPLYNDGNHEACFRVYAATALKINRKNKNCKGPRKALMLGVANADNYDDWTKKAWAMRDAFDGVLDVIQRSATESRHNAGGKKRKLNRHIPRHSLSLLDNCTQSDLQIIRNAIRGAINIGAPLYNDGNIEACYRVYEGAILDVGARVTSCTGPTNALNDGLHVAKSRNGYVDKAWALRDAFDGVIDVMQRNNENTSAYEDEE